MAEPSATAAPEPDLAACPKALANEERMRSTPLAIPAAFGRAKADLDHIAVAAESGNTLCVDTSWIEEIVSPRASADGRFLSFAWHGYESFGHVLIDRSGEGQVIDTGETPRASPSGRRFAAVDLGEAGFGALNAFGVWDVRQVGLRQIAKVSEGLPSGDWRLAGWQGEDCVRLALLPSDRLPEDVADLDRAPRDPWFASESNAWKPLPGSCPGA
ncbi:MAG: hypothetical protein B7Z08_12730 [Sphingomonadales bacterium 32-68-7]|nr:MAG: hypothetical protein B7Z33_06460 [Sphingomonadales bacterium 12-68-11]OYX07231.1 MAG: hypothetical protein B7Z08_12730 [Sphingomonadales bacterium 32-68-7]